MKIEYKLQNDVLKGKKRWYAKCGELTFLTDGHIGVYLTAEEVKIDLSKTVKMPNAKEYFPEKMLKENTLSAFETHSAIFIDGGSTIAKKIKSNTTENYVYANINYLKLFGAYGELRISEDKPSLILVLDHYKNPYGIILPINISDDYV